MQPDMKPEATRSSVGPENLPMPPTSGGEHIPVLPTPETGLDTGAERHEQVAEASAAIADAAAAGAVPVAPIVDDPTATTPTSTGSPIVASNDDVIEKEWVDKAKEIILKTKDDPHGRTSLVNELQKDYLKKRYGKELGAS